MDYLEIIREGYLDKTERENLSDYLLEQYHKAESKTMTLKRFFDGCFNTIEALNKDIETKIIKRKEELINWAENSENNKDHYIGELKAINIDNFTTTLPQGGQLRAKDIDFIHEAIQTANVKGLFDELGKAGNIYLNELKEMFFKKYGKPNQRTVTDELNEINNFIAKAESFSTKETFKSTIDEYKHSDINRIDLEQIFEYSRLKHGYYKNKENFSSYFTIFFNVQTTWVYSKYFLYKKWLEDLNKQFAPQPTGKPQPIKTKAENLKEYLSQYGFFELEKVKALSEQSKALLIEKISESGLPYAIAMFDFLQFIQYLEKKHFDTKEKINIEISKWFNKDRTGRAVKGNISSLLKNTTENKTRYTAYKHIEKVEKYYKSLK